MQPVYQGTAFCRLYCGRRVAVCCSVQFELFFVLSSLWMHPIYYLFGFPFLVIVILFITCSEVSIVLVYFQICSEDYRWWWRSFLVSASCSFYLFLYAIFFTSPNSTLHAWSPASFTSPTCAPLPSVADVCAYLRAQLFSGSSFFCLLLGHRNNRLSRQLVVLEKVTPPCALQLRVFSPPAAPSPRIV